MPADPETMLLAALTANQPVVSGYQRHEERAVYAGDVMPPAAFVRVVRNAKGATERCSAAEVHQMVRLFHELGKDTEPKVCHRIAELLDRPRSPACVSGKLAELGVRPLCTKGRREAPAGGSR